MKTVQLVRVTEPVRTWTPSRDPGQEFTYLDLSSVDNQTKRIVNPVHLLGAEAPSRARQLVQAGDVLVSTVRPNLNAVAAVDENLDGATASTGFTVLRPNHDLDSRYLFHWVRSTQFIADMVRKATGASYPAVSDRIVKESSLPLPALDDQRRIAAILDDADALRMQAANVIAEADQLEQAIFVEMFGEPLSNPHGYTFERLGVVGTLDRGVSKHRPRNDAALLGGPYPLIQTGDVARSGGTISSYSATYSELGLAQSRMWPAGTLCITIAANIAQTGVLEFDACFPDSVVGFTADESTTAYVRTWFTFLQATLEAAAPQSAQRNINLAILRDLPVPLPPVADRKHFHECLRKVQEMRTVAVRRDQQLDELFASLQSSAFSGQL